MPTRKEKKMNTQQLRRILNQDPVTKMLFLDVFSSDKLPTKIHKYPTCFIVNVDSSREPGSHWLAVYLPSAYHAEFFDSYGKPPTYYGGPILDFTSRFLYLDYNPMILQTDVTAVCGQYCIYYLYSRCRGQPLMKVLSPFVTQDLCNDKLVYNFVWKRFHVRANFFQ